MVCNLNIKAEKRDKETLCYKTESMEAKRTYWQYVIYLRVQTTGVGNASAEPFAEKRVTSPCPAQV